MEDGGEVREEVFGQSGIEVFGLGNFAAFVSTCRTDCSTGRGSLGTRHGSCVVGRDGLISAA